MASLYAILDAAKPTTTKPAATTSSSKPAATKPAAVKTTAAAKPSATSASSGSSGATVSAYGQCGGNNWTGATACASGLKCIKHNDYYSQCVPA
ncbi:hypothetical protein NW754_001529 [Fusarium falciforme]|nr:hypothetical protein NW754_001529 [Fusarium falciforme]